MVLNHSGPAGRTPGHRRALVFVSYAHDSPSHKDDVFRLCQLLQINGADIWLDRLVRERVNWGHLTLTKIREADYVLVIASPGYRRAGDGLARADEHPNLQAEIGLLRELLQEDRPTWTRKILPVLLPGRTVADFPMFLHPRNETHYKVRDLTADGARALIRLLANQSAYHLPDSSDTPNLPLRNPNRSNIAPFGRVAEGGAISDGNDYCMHDGGGSHRIPYSPSAQRNMNKVDNWAKFAIVDHEELFGIGAAIERLGIRLRNRDGAWIISIFGAPGAGKTTLAYEAVKRHAVNAGYQRIAWVSAKTAHITSLGEIEKERRTVNNWRDMLLEIADQLQLEASPNPMTIEREFARSISSLDDDSQCLIVVDNLEAVQDAKAAIRYIEHESLIRPHKIILTTRESAAQHSGSVWEMRWDGLDPIPARKYAEYLGQDDRDLDLGRKDLDEIVVASERIPLLIKLIVKLAIFERRPISDIVVRMRDNQVDLGSNVGGYLYEESLNALASRVGESNAEKLINVFCAKVSGESFTSDEFYRLSRIPEKAIFEQVKAAACQLALIRSLDGNTRFTVHSLLREFVCN